MNRANTPYDSEHAPINCCDCCGKPRKLSFSVSYGLDTWACVECRGNKPDREKYADAAEAARLPDGSISASRFIANCNAVDKAERWPAANYDENFKPRKESK